MIDPVNASKLTGKFNNFDCELYRTNSNAKQDKKASKQGSPGGHTTYVS